MRLSVSLTNKASLVEDVRKGRWGEGLTAVEWLGPPAIKRPVTSWEHDSKGVWSPRGEPKAAKSVLEGASPLLYLRETDPGRLDASENGWSLGARSSNDYGGQACDSAQDTVDRRPCRTPRC